LTKIETLDVALDKVTQAELPFLKGIEVLPVDEFKEMVSASEAACSAVHVAVNDARTFIASKQLEVRRFKEEKVSKHISAEFAQLTERINKAASLSASHRKDTDARKQVAHMQEAEEKVADVEREVGKTTEAAKPLAAGGEEISQEAAVGICEKLQSLEKATQAKILKRKPSF
jgi:hypothetical protein